jgi:hypothetical protein
MFRAGSRVSETTCELLCSKVIIFWDVMLYGIIIIIIIIIIKHYLRLEYGNSRFFGKGGNCLPIGIASFSRRRL